MTATAAMLERGVQAARERDAEKVLRVLVELAGRPGREVAPVLLERLTEAQGTGAPLASQGDLELPTHEEALRLREQLEDSAMDLTQIADGTYEGILGVALCSIAVLEASFGVRH